MPKYDAHVAYVAGKAPCTPERWETTTVHSELVLFENAAILPRFILSLDVLEAGLAASSGVTGHQ